MPPGLHPASGTSSKVPRGRSQAPVAHQVRGPGRPPDAAILNHLLAVSAIALAVMASRLARARLADRRAGCCGPLRQMTAAARAISEDSLHQRLAVPGPGDELKDLGDTIDGLLERLEAAFDAQRNFVASASHELRTPLTLERAMLEVALADPQAIPPPYRAVCEDVLASRPPAGTADRRAAHPRPQPAWPGPPRPLDLADITREILDAREPDAAARGLAITASISPAPVLGDARLLQRLAANLIDNAIRHNIHRWPDRHPGHASGGHPALTITNTGPVIQPGQTNRLLQPFQRLSSSRSADTEGLGLGLSIVAAIAKAHHATLAISPSPTEASASTSASRLPLPPPRAGEKRSPQPDKPRDAYRPRQYPARPDCARRPVSLLVSFTPSGTVHRRSLASSPCRSQTARRRTPASRVGKRVGGNPSGVRISYPPPR